LLPVEPILSTPEPGDEKNDDDDDSIEDDDDDDDKAKGAVMSRSPPTRRWISVRVGSGTVGRPNKDDRNPI
jgi:hypothetical protein